MSRYFVTDAPVPIAEFDVTEVVSDVKPNIIWIKPKMDVATKGKVSSELFTMDKAGALEARLGANETALLVHNIVRWEGPDFDGVPCTPENIRKMDPTEPHLAAVLEAIAERNKAPKSPKEQRGTSTSTSAISTDLNIHPSQDPSPSVSLQLATGTEKLTLRSALDGRIAKSENSIPIT